jgi:hypothetical protein
VDFYQYRATDGAQVVVSCPDFVSFLFLTNTHSTGQYFEEHKWIKSLNFLKVVFR